MRFRHCLGALLLLAASAPAMADMYLFDGRAWVAGHADTASREQTSGNGQGRIAVPVERVPNLRSARFVDQIQALPTGCWLQHELRLPPASARCE